MIEILSVLSLILATGMLHFGLRFWFATKEIETYRKEVGWLDDEVGRLKRELKKLKEYKKPLQFPTKSPDSHKKIDVRNYPSYKNRP